MLTGRYVSETATPNNGEGIARSTKTGKLDSNCVSTWGAAACTAFGAQQPVNETFLDRIEAAGYDMQLFARFDVGAGVLDDYPAAGKGAAPSGNGFHGGPSLGKASSFHSRKRRSCQAWGRVPTFPATWPLTLLVCFCGSFTRK